MAQRRLAQETRQNLNVQRANLPRVYELEALYAPLFDALGMQSFEQGLLGSEGGTVTLPVRRGGRWTTEEITTPGSRGYLDIYENDIAPIMEALGSRSREVFMDDFGRLTPMYRESFDSANPDMAALLRELTGQATDELELGAALNPSEMRTASQSFRSAVGDRGLDMNMDAFLEALGTTDYGRKLQRERRAFAGDVFNMNRESYVDPVWRALGVSTPHGAATSAAGAASGIVAGSGTQHFDPYFQYGADLRSQNSQIHAMPYNPMTEGYRNTQMGVQMGGQIIGSIMSGMGCWVAREVYGSERAGGVEKWLLFRHWLLTRAPAGLRDLYFRAGPALADWLRFAPEETRAAVRRFMNARIAELEA